MAVHTHQHFALQGTAASRPAAPTFDLIYYATDTGQLSIYDTVGAAWTNIGFSGLALPVTIAQGGTGQTAKTAAFDALSPLSTKGDLIVHDGTNNVRRAVPSDGSFNIADSTQTDGWFNVRYTGAETLLSDTAGGVAYITGAAYAEVDPSGIGSTHPTRTKIDLTAFTQGRIIAVGRAGAPATSGTTKIVDTTGSFDLTGTVGFTTTTNTLKVGSWTTFNAGSRADVVLEAQALEGTGGDTLLYEKIVFQFRG